MAKLSAGVMEEIKEVVSIFDKVGDGKVDVNDIINVLRSLGKRTLRYYLLFFFIHNIVGHTGDVECKMNICSGLFHLLEIENQI